MRKNPGEGGPTGSPPASAEAAAAQRQRLGLASARLTVRVQLADGTILPEAALRFVGNGLDSIAFDPVEGRVNIMVSVPILSGTAAARPADPGRPTIYIATDTGAHSSWDGATWRTI